MTNLQDKTPTSFNEAVQLLVSGLTPIEIEFIKNHEPHEIHHGVGTLIRNNWNLWVKESPLVQDVLNKFGVIHGDDVSGLLFTALWSTVKGMDVNTALKEKADRYINHWKDCGIDPKTGEEITEITESGKVKYFYVKTN
jgi:hypothetical protein